MSATARTPLPSMLSVGELLLAVLDMYLGGERNAGWSRPELESLRTKLETAEPAQRDALELAGASFRRPLIEILGARRHAESDNERGRDLRTVVRALRCILDRAAFDPTVDPRHLVVRYSEADLTRLLRAVTAPFDELAATRNVRFVVSAPDRLVAEVDVEKVELIIATLLFNAFKYTPEGGVIEIRLELDAREGEAALFVRDSGQAIAPHLARAIFDRSRQLDRSVLSQSGIGLGASHDSAVLHGGSLELLRPRETGAVFRMLLPLRAPSGIPVCTAASYAPNMAVRVAALAKSELDAEAALEATPAVRDGRPLVLIVEDSRSLQRVIRQHLEPTYNTVSAFDLTTALSMAKDLAPDLVVVDVELQCAGPRGPVHCGEGLVMELRASPWANEIPILVLTEADDPARTVRLLSEYVQDVVRKPFLLPELGVRVKNLVEAKKTRDLLRGNVGRHEEDLVKLAEEVTRHQKRLAETLEEVRLAREFAESASRIKSNFLRMVSHELKTPVAAIQLHIRVLERDPRLTNLPPLTEGLARIGQSTQRLLHLVDTVIEWARVESGRCRIAVELVDLSELAHDISRELRRHAASKGIELLIETTAAGRKVATDARIARLLALNLVLRGIQHTDAGSVKVSVDQTTDGRFRFAVQDQGLRIHPRERSLVFEPLRSDNDVRWIEGAGSGLGLYVIRDIARAIEGDLCLDEPASGGERGNVFALLLPTLPHDEPSVNGHTIGGAELVPNEGGFR